MQKYLKVFDSLTKYASATLLLAVILYPKFPFIKVPGTYVSVRIEDFVLLVITIILGVRILPNIRKVLKSDIERSLVVFIFVGLASLLAGILITRTVSPTIGFLHWARRIEYFIPFFLGVLLVKNEGKEKISFIVKTITVGVGMAFIYGFGQKHLAWPVIITQNEEYAKGIALRWIEGSHINSTFAGHYDLATFLVLVLPILITSLFLLKGIKTRIFLSLIIAAGMWLMSAAVSRISILSFLIGTSLALVLAKKYLAVPLVVVVSLIFFSFSSNLISRYMRVIDVARKSILRLNYQVIPPIYAASDSGVGSEVAINFTPEPTSVPVFEDRSTSIRLNVEWPRAVRAWAKNPLLGTGYSSITLATDNDYLRLLGEVGAFGFLAFMLIIVRIGWSIFKSLPLTNKYSDIQLAYLVGLTGGFVGVLINAVFIDVFEASKLAIILWLLIGITVGTLRNNRYEY